MSAQAVGDRSGSAASHAAAWKAPRKARERQRHDHDFASGFPQDRHGGRRRGRIRAAGELARFPASTKRDVRCRRRRDIDLPRDGEGCVGASESETARVGAPSA
jgi:hypothetical protein